MKDAAAGLELPKDPHPTRRRRATFSHEWEKDAPEFCGKPNETTLA
jgi:hypothetical protein